MAGADVPQMGHVARPPFPRGPEDAAQQGFHGAGRHVDQEAVVQLASVQLDAVCDGLKVGADEIDMPTMLVLLTGLNDGPRLTYEGGKAFFGIDEVKLVQRLVDVDLLIAICDVAWHQQLRPKRSTR